MKLFSKKWFLYLCCFCLPFLFAGIVGMGLIICDYYSNIDYEIQVAKAEEPLAVYDYDLVLSSGNLNDSIALPSSSGYCFFTFGRTFSSDNVIGDLGVDFCIFSENFNVLSYFSNLNWSGSFGNRYFVTDNAYNKINASFSVPSTNFNFGSFCVYNISSSPLYLFSLNISFNYSGDIYNFHFGDDSLFNTLYDYNLDVTESAFSSGYDTGYNAGNLEGYEEGYVVGYEDGYDVGLEDGSTNGYEIGYEDGYAVGYNDGLDVFVADLKDTKSIYQIYHTDQVIPSNSGAVFNVSADGIGFYSTDNIYQTLELRLYFWLGNDLSLNFDLNLDIVNYLDTLTEVNLYLTPVAPMQNYGLYKMQEYEYDSNLTIEENNVALSQMFSLDGFSALERPFVMLQFIYDWAYPVNETIVTLNGSLSVYDSYATLIDNYRNEIETIYDNEIRYDSASYIAGVESGTQRGYEVGYSEGLIDGSGGINFGEFFFSIIDAPIQAVLNLFNFEIFGYNMRSFFLAIFSICLVVVVIRLILRMRS